MNILIVLTSHDKLGSTGKKTGFWLEELATPYYMLKDAGATVTLASPKGGRAPMDPRSNASAAQTESTRRFMADGEALAALVSTRKLADVRAEEYDAVFYPGGHGPLWDLSESRLSAALIEKSIALGHPVAAVCHGPGVFRKVKDPSGRPLVKNKSVTGFSDSEEKQSGLDGDIPFWVEDMLKQNGGKYSKAADWHSHVVTDGLIITGQNPQSSSEIAQQLLALLKMPIT